MKRKNDSVTLSTVNKEVVREPRRFKPGAVRGFPLTSTRFGAVIGLLWILPLLLVFHGVWNVPLTLVIVDAAWHVVEEGVAGVVIAFVYGAGAAASSE